MQRVVFRIITITITYTKRHHLNYNVVLCVLVGTSVAKTDEFPDRQSTLNGRTVRAHQGGKRRSPSPRPHA